MAAAFVRLKDGAAWTLLTTLEELKGFEERKGTARPKGVEHGVYAGDKNWLEAKRADDRPRSATTSSPIASSSAAVRAASRSGRGSSNSTCRRSSWRRTPRAGDSWRNRYRSLVLHDPVWYDHLPYIPFPDNWPMFTPKDKLGDWLEMYVKVMELDYWASSECVHAALRSQTSKTWTVEVTRAGERIVLRPKQLVFATGAYGPPERDRVARRRAISRRDAITRAATRPAQRL